MAGPFVGGCGLFADLGTRDYEQTGERRRVLRIFGEQSYGPLNESEMSAGLESLTLIERLLCRPLIVRQLRFSPSVGRDLRDFGPTGLIKLSSARALKVFLFVLGVVAVALSFAHVGPPAFITIWTLILLLFAFVLIRAVTAAREAKRYRRHRSAADLQQE
jgi:hypothetical protein